MMDDRTIKMHSSDPTSNRRSFLKQTAAAAATVSFPAVVRSASPNSMVQVASVGADGMAYTDIKNIASHPKVKYVAFCDVDATRFGRADAEVAGVPHYADFREMLEKLGDKVDAINVGTPDHMHALPAIEAMKRGKHVYCQKPLAHTVWEARQMRLWAEKTGVISQMGNQIHSAIEYRLGTTLIRQGAIGKIKEVHSWIGVSGNERTRLLEPPKKGGTPPSTLNWDLWIGGAPMREFVQDTYHPFVWRDWQDFGGGGLGDFGCHVLDPVFTALDLKAPISVVADNSGINSHVWPVNETVRWIFPKNDLIAGDTLRVTWTDGGLKPVRKIAQMPPELDLPGGGSIFVGEKGNMVLAHVAGPRLYPAQKFQGFEYPKLEKIASHWHRWIDGIIENKKTTDGFHYAGWLAETVQLGNVATRLATRPADPRGGHDIESEHATVLKWDAEALRFTNHADADKLLTKEYRDGWKVAAV
jgi:predicted dehydrogenase